MTPGPGRIVSHEAFNPEGMPCQG